MRRSKLRLYEDILCSLHSKAKTIDEIAYNINMDCMSLRSRMKFLLKNRLIEEKNYKKMTLYALTRRGLAIYNTVMITNQLKKLQINIHKMDKALQTIHVFSGQELEKNNQNK